MNHEQKIRYSRHLSLPEIGEAGQERLLAAKVLVIGAGGLGSPLLLYLAGAGVGTIGIVDDDRVDLSNLQRQVLHETGDIGQPKVYSAREAMLDLNPDIAVNCYEVRLTAENIDDIINDYDIIADGSDNRETRFLLNERCYALGKTLVSAAVQGFSGQLYTFKAYLGEPYPCYRCIYPNVSSVPSCSESGVMGSVAGVMGTWQAVEVIKELLEIGERTSCNMVIFDGLAATSRKVSVRRNLECVCCSDSPRG